MAKFNGLRSSSPRWGTSNFVSNWTLGSHRKLSDSASLIDGEPTLTGSSTTINATFDRALKVDSDLLNNIEGCIRDFYQSARAKILAESPYTVADIPNALEAKRRSDDADQAREYDLSRTYRDLFNQLIYLDEIRYSLVLSDATSISNITLQDVLALSNASAEAIYSVSISNGGYGDNHFTIRFMDRSSSCVEFSCQ